MNWHFVGVDLGQAKDFTAIAAVERAETAGAWDPAVFTSRKTASLRLRYLERVALGTPYQDVVERVVGLTRSDELAGRRHLVVDATGVGRPVVDLLRRAGPGCGMMPATITGGDRQSQEGGYYRVPKRDAIVGLQVLLQNGELKIASGLRYPLDSGSDYGLWSRPLGASLSIPRWWPVPVPRDRSDGRYPQNTQVFETMAWIF